MVSPRQLPPYIDAWVEQTLTLAETSGRADLAEEIGCGQAQRVADIVRKEGVSGG